jgi:GTP-binding protein EngB required for normal cell division
MIINFIDSPGLFQQTKSLPNNTTIMQLIDGYIRSKVTELHFVCLCTSIDAKLNEEDLRTVQSFFSVLGPDIRKNTCLVITKCESKTEEQLEARLKEVETNLDFKVLSSQLKQGIFFMGAINRDDWIDTSDSVFPQFEKLCEYRNKLLNLFIDGDIKPFDINANALGRKIREEMRKGK